MVTRIPFVNAVEGLHRHPFMETARGEGVVELDRGIGCKLSD